jgi:hypothetical protein
MCGQVEILMRSHLWAASQALTLHRHELVTAIASASFEHAKVEYCKMCPSIRALHYGFNTAVPHITVVKCAKGCPKVILDAGLVADMKLQFPGLHAHLT